MIHSTAIIEKSAKIDKDVQIGAHVVISGNVTIKSGAIIDHHAFIDCITEIGHDVHIHPFASVGSIPQDLKFKKGEPSYCFVGDRTVIREFTAINSGTGVDTPTRIGSDCLLMAYAHLGHNASIGNGVIIANAGTIAGHVEIADNVIIGGLTGIHQFVHIGELVIVGGCSKVVKDIPPYMLVDGNPSRVRSINTIGLQRKGYSKEVLSKLKDAFKILYKKGMTFSKAQSTLQKKLGDTLEVQKIISFIDNSERGLTGGKR